MRIARLGEGDRRGGREAPESMRELIQALQALRGVAKVGAVTIVAEVGTLSRFEHPRQLMGYSGAVSSEHSSGGKIRRGGDYQDGQRPFAARHRGGGVVATLQTSAQPRDAQAPGRPECRSAGDCIEGTSPTA